MALNPELLALLACPVCRGELEPVDNESGLECPACGLVFPVRDNIPIMLQEEAIRKETIPLRQEKHVHPDMLFLYEKTTFPIQSGMSPQSLSIPALLP